MSTKVTEAAKPQTLGHSSLVIGHSPAEGWGHTRGWSKKLHYFVDGFSVCANSQPRPGEPLLTSHDTSTDPPCHDCLKYTRTHKPNSNHQRGVARLQGRVTQREPAFRKGRAKLYA